MGFSHIKDQILSQHDFRRAQPCQFRVKTMLLHAKRLEPAGGNISGGKRDFSACPAYRHQHIVAARVEQAVLRQRSRRHVADDGTSDERLRSEEHTSELQSLMRISY